MTKLSVFEFCKPVLMGDQLSPEFTLLNIPSWFVPAYKFDGFRGSIVITETLPPIGSYRVQVTGSLLSDVGDTCWVGRENGSWVEVGAGVGEDKAVGVLVTGNNDIWSILFLVSSVGAVRDLSPAIIFTEMTHKSNTRIVITISRIAYSDLSEISLGGVINFPWIDYAWTDSLVGKVRRRHFMQPVYAWDQKARSLQGRASS